MNLCPYLLVLLTILQSFILLTHLGKTVITCTYMLHNFAHSGTIIGYDPPNMYPM